MKKGFTLIELLAVIVILAIIALIATPIILGVVENARKSAAGSSALGYIDAVEKEIALDGMNNIIYPTGDIDILTSDYYKTIEVQGEKPSKGSLVVSDRYLITSATLCVNNYKVELTGHKISKITKDGCDDMETPEPPVEDKKPKFSGVEDTEVQQWTEFDPKEGVTATDSEGNDITERIEIDRGNFTTAIADTYILTYSVSDEAGNEATAERKVTVIPSEYIDNSGAASPNLKGGLIPVTIDDDGTVHQADVTSRWYDYDEKKWANAVILNDNASVGEDGIITEDSINAYFVWIPKFRYQLWRVNNETSTPHEIPIEFNLENTIDGDDTCKTPMISGNVGACAKDKWMTHPAFINFDVNGFWVGKFETGYKGATSISTAQVDSSENDKIIVKPNVYSWRYITLKNMFDAAYNYSRNTLDSHMMKNTEWGAVAILSHSKYGINQEVGINNFGFSNGSDAYKTGCGAAAESTYSSTCNPYNSASGKLASTTGNITGIYDMSGGAHEYVAGYLKDNYGVSGFNATNITGYENYEKYFDIYTNTTNNRFNFAGQILGDITNETGLLDDGLGNWYLDTVRFVYTGCPWFLRGSSWTQNRYAGIFGSNHDTGQPWGEFTFRLVLAPK